MQTIIESWLHVKQLVEIGIGVLLGIILVLMTWGWV